MTVLIVDETVSMESSVHNMMKIIGFGRRFLFAVGGEEVFEILRQEPIDLVMIDYNLPGIK